MRARGCGKKLADKIEHVANTIAFGTKSQDEGLLGTDDEDYIPDNEGDNNDDVISLMPHLYNCLVCFHV